MGLRRPPYAFTEQGVAMLSSVLKSKRAVQVNIQIMRAFVRLRELLATHKDLARKLAALERKYDAQFKVVFDAIRELRLPIYLDTKLQTPVQDLANRTGRDVGDVVNRIVEKEVRLIDELESHKET
jgi:hypothetical protein